MARVTIQPDSKMVAFVTNLSQKLKKLKDPTELPTSIIAPIMTLQNENQTYATEETKSVEICTYCNNPNHNEKRCYKPQKDTQKSAIPVRETKRE